MDASPPSPSLSVVTGSSNMDSSPASSTSSSSTEAQRPQPGDHYQQQAASKKTRLATAVPVSATEEPSTEAAAAALPPPSLDALPARTLREIGAFAAGESNLSGTSRKSLEAVGEVHLKTGYCENYHYFSLKNFHSLLIGPTGALKSGRVVAHITIVYAMTPGTEEAIEVFEKFMRHTIPTLRSINYFAEGGECLILDALIPRSSKRYIVAPNLTRVKLRGQPTLIHKAGKVTKAGLWPALEELDVGYCGASAGHFENLAQAIRSGRAQNLRLLNWDCQSETRNKRLDDVVLSALASGQCPLIERLSFTDNRFCPEHDIHTLGGALRACSNLRVLEMDCSRSPGRDLRTLTRALEAGHVPHLTWIFARATKPYVARDGTREGVEVLRRVAAQRATPVEIHTEIKTCRPKIKAPVEIHTEIKTCRPKY